MQMSRRDLVGAGAAVAAAALTPKVTFGGWEPSERYPDPAIKILDPSFAKYRIFNAGVERLFTGARWSEGPVWMGDWRCLLWSDIPNNRILRWDEETGRTSVFRKPSNYSNGNTRDRQGRLVTCEHDARRLTRTEYDGTITVLIDKFDGKPLNSPNDVVVKSDGSIWFTDPTPRHRRQLRGPCGPAGTAHQRLPPRPADRPRHRGGRRHPPERPVLLPRRAQDVHRRLQQRSAPDPCLRRGGQRHQAGQFTRLRDLRGGGDPGRLPLRHRRQSVVRLGHRAEISTASWCSTRKASGSARSHSPNAPPTCASAGSSATACSWRQATRSTRSMWAPRGRSGGELTLRYAQKPDGRAHPGHPALIARLTRGACTRHDPHDAEDRDFDLDRTRSSGKIPRDRSSSEMASVPR